jgi:hypothetical protein
LINVQYLCAKCAIGERISDRGQIQRKGVEKVRKHLVVCTTPILRMVLRGKFGEEQLSCSRSRKEKEDHTPYEIKVCPKSAVIFIGNCFSV